MKIVQLTAENVKRLVAVEIAPTGALVEISGRNGQGKTSVLDAIWWALAGTDAIQVQPIRKEADKARIRLDLGEFVVTRTFSGKASGYTTTLKVEAADGTPQAKPQTLLDSFMGALTFDPLGFTRMDAKGQFETLRALVPGYDFAAADRANQADYDRRHQVNQQAKQLRAQAAGVVVPPNLPKERPDEDGLLRQLQDAAEHNGGIQRRQANREARQAEREEKIAAALKHREEAARLLTLAEELEARVAEIDQLFASAPALPEPIDTSKVSEQIAQVRRVTAAMDARDRRDDLVRQAEELEAESTALTAGMVKREDEKRAAVAAAALPVNGIAFGDEQILLNGVPFAQASDAEALRASIAIAMAMNPKLRVIRVRDGSLLDEQGMAILREVAEANDFQVWIERVGAGRTGFVLEDGQLLRAPAAAEAAE